MKTYDENDLKSVALYCHENLASCLVFSLATVSPDGRPWSICLNLSVDDKGDIIWRSHKMTEHSQHISHNSNAAISAFLHTGDVEFGFYARATVHEVVDELELKKNVSVRYTQRDSGSLPDNTELAGESPYRLYHATLTDVWVSDVRHLKTRVDLDTLRGLIK